MLFLNIYRTNGFALIELIIVIIIVSILAIVALPKFIDLSGDAQLAATRSIAGSISSANAENYAFRIEKNTNGVRINNCTSAANLLQGGLPSGYTITGAQVKVNTTKTCTLKGPSSTTATFTVTGIR